MEELWMSNYFKKKEVEGMGNRRLKVVSFPERGKTSRHISLTANTRGVKVNFCQDVKTEETRRKLFVPYC